MMWSKAAESGVTEEQPTHPTAQSKVESSLVRKLDIWLLPTLITMCWFQAVDKSLIGTAKIDGIEADLGLTQNQYNVALSVFQVGFLLLQIPSNLLITRVRPSIYLPACCLAWSTVAVCHVLVRNYKGLLVLCVLLGFCDAPYYAGAIHVLSSWYTKKELVTRTSVLLASIIAAFVAVAPMSAAIIDSLGGRNGWKGWRWLYLVFGLCGFAPAFFRVMTLPDYPTTHHHRFWLTEAEQSSARARMEEDRVNENEVKGEAIWSGFKAAMKDKRTWIFVLMFVSRKSLEGLLYYLPEVVKSFNLFPKSHLTRNTLALCLTSPPSLLAAALALFLAYTSNRYEERTYHIAIPLLFAAVTLVISAATFNPVARYASMFFYIGGSISSAGLAWSWVPNAIQETPEKKASAIAIVNVFGGIGSVFAPFLFRRQDYPGYRLAFIVITSFVALEIGCCILMRYALKQQNLRMQRHSESSAGSADSRAHLL